MQINPLTSTADGVTDQDAEAERIHVGNCREVEDLFHLQRTFRRRFEDVAEGVRRQGVVHIPRCEWPGQSKYGTIHVAVRSFDGEPCTAPDFGFYDWHRNSFPVWLFENAVVE